MFDNWTKDRLNRSTAERYGEDNWEKVVPIDHGYDESKPASLLELEDIKDAAKFRGGKCLSSSMTKVI